MPLTKPYKRTCRQLKDGSYGNSANYRYILHPDYALAPGLYVRAFVLIQKDLRELFDYIEPADANWDTYSFRIQQLMLRTCIEVEANFKAILTENEYKSKGRWTLLDYWKTNQSHRMSSYEVWLPEWDGANGKRTPFKAWETALRNEEKRLDWHSTYNAVKHDRVNSFNEATLGNLIDAVCGLVVLLSAQFWTCAFIPGNTLLSVGGPEDGTEMAIGDYFRVKFPEDWEESERYDINWPLLSMDPSPIVKYPYNA